MKLDLHTRKLIWSYLPDWLLTIILTAAFFSLDNVDGFRREFSLSDTSLSHRFAVHEHVPDIALFFISLVAPILLQLVINLITVRSWWDLHTSTLGLLLSFSITEAITQSMKLSVGRPRPDIIDRCQPTQGAVDPLYGLSTWHVCTQTDIKILREGFRSFPSGHASLSFSGLGFMGYYLAGKLHLFDKCGHTRKAWISLAPFTVAALIAISRTIDYRHHWEDVLIGSILGTVVSYFSYRQYYPPLSSETSHKPYSPRIKREGERPILPVYHEEHTESSTSISQQEQGRPDTVRHLSGYEDNRSSRTYWWEKYTGSLRKGRKNKPKPSPDPACLN